MTRVTLSHVIIFSFTNLCGCVHAALVDEDGNQNCVGAAVIFPPMDAPFRGVDEEVGYDHRQRKEEAAVICDGRTAEVNAAETSAAAENRRSRTCRQKREGDATVAAAASAGVTTIGRPEVEDVD